ncbi:hypothetical protein B5X24_HaOG205036 [Helicoverpa armigera]|nr:hypothetical protein B5X24_HaOG205036 [Helicoverpa armigera]
MNRKYILAAFAILLIVCAEGRKTSGRSRGSGSGRGSSKKTNYNPQPAPTSFSNPQASAPKPTLFGWQERTAQKSNTQTLSSWQSKPSSGQSHSYPSSGTGLSGDKTKPQVNHESVQRSSAPNNLAGQQHTNSQPGHSYPSSNGLSGSGSGYPQQTASKYPQQQGSGVSGNTGTGQAGYPQSHGSGLSGSGQPGHSYPQQTGSGSGYPQQSGSGSGYPQHNNGGPGSAVAPPPYSGPNYQNNYGNNYHPQGPPPPYSNYGSSYGGMGGHGGYNPGYGSQAPGYFGNYGNYGKGSGGMSRTGSALTGVGIAGAGIGTVLTGLALWNLARSTGQHHHTVIYDNRGQPVAVAPSNDTAPVADSILADLVNCSLTISNDDKTEVLAIPCSIATSFTPEADVKESGINENKNDNTKCTITVLTKAGKEFMTTIPCSILLNTAAENNVTEPPLVVDESANISNVTNDAVIQNGTLMDSNATLSEPTALRLSGDDINLDDAKLSHLNCTPHSGEIRDPINPCFAVNHNLTVIPLPATEEPK